MSGPAVVHNVHAMFVIASDCENKFESVTRVGVVNWVCGKTNHVLYC